MTWLATRAATLIAVALFSAAPAVAKPPPALIWVEYHFKDTKAHIHTITERIQIVRADYAEKACQISPAHAAAEGSFELSRHPELAGMTFVGENCVLDKSGKIKVVVATPTGGN